MAIEESIEFFPLFNPGTAAAEPAVSVAIGDHIAVVGTPDALEGAGAVTFYAYSEDSRQWGYVGVMIGSRRQSSHDVRRLGQSCLVVGDTVMVGAPGDEGSPGAVLVFRPPYGVWTYGCVPGATVLQPAEPQWGDSFGTSIGYCSDGTDEWVIVGAPAAKPPRGPFGQGMAHIFKGLDSNPPWSTSPIANPDEAGKETDRFGATVAINPGVDGEGRPDGTLVFAVGAPGAKEGEGAVYVGRTTERDSWPNRFSFDQAIEPQFPDFIPEDFRTAEYGSSVAMTGGALLAVGAPADPNFEKEIEGTGAVWIYNLVDGKFVPKELGGSLWGDDADHRFGSAVAFPHTVASGSGDTATVAQADHLVVGAPGGRAGYRYDNAGGKDFPLGQQYKCYGGKKGDGYGAAVATSVHASGPWSLVGAAGKPAGGDDGEVDGGAYLYAEGESGLSWADPPALLELPHFNWFNSEPASYKQFTPKIERYL